MKYRLAALMVWMFGMQGPLPAGAAQQPATEPHESLARCLERRAVLAGTTLSSWSNLEFTRRLREGAMD